MLPLLLIFTKPCFVVCVRGGIPTVENTYLEAKVSFSEQGLEGISFEGRRGVNDFDS